MLRHRLGTARAMGLGLLVTLLSACGPGGRYIDAVNYRPTQAAPPRKSTDLIQVNDAVTVSVFGQEAMSVTGTVRPNGVLAIPLVGEYPVAGKRPSALAKELEQRLTPFVTSPRVTVVIQSAPVRVAVIGETGSGLQALEWPLVRLVDALAAAGGLNEYADQDSIFVLRGDERIRFEYDDIVRGAPHAKEFVMQSGDVVVVE